MKTMVDWEVTAITIFCDSVKDEVTVIVNGDGSFKCSGLLKYGKPNNEISNTLKAKSKISGKLLACMGDDCATAKQYRDKFMSEK